MLVSGRIGLYASFVLSIEALTLAADSIAVLACDLSSVISCSTVALFGRVAYSAGLVFALWLFVQGFVAFGALCPWCLLITVTTTLVWAGLTRLDLRDGHLRLSGVNSPCTGRFPDVGNNCFNKA